MRNLTIQINYLIILVFLLSSCASNQATMINGPKGESDNLTVKKKSNEILRRWSPYHYEIKKGEVIRVEMQHPTDSAEMALLCGAKKMPSYFVNGTRIAFIVESYFSKSKKYKCYIKKENSKQKLIADITVKFKKYPQERLHVDKKRVTISKIDLKRVRSEQAFLNSIYASSKNIPAFTTGFKTPLNSKITSIYGTKRIFNNKKHTQHLGTDYRAKVGIDINSTNSGKVVVARDLFYTGKTVIIDHGLNIFTVYGHLSHLSVVEGIHVKKNELLGRSGKSGRVTGPHLHWGVKVNWQYIDGKSLVDATQHL